MMKSDAPLQVTASALDAVADDAGPASGPSDGDKQPALPQQRGNNLAVFVSHARSSVRAGIQPPLKPCLAASSGEEQSSGNDAKASGSALLREGQSPFPFVRLGLVAATIVAALTVTGCARERLFSAEYVEGAALSERRAPRDVGAAEVAATECRPLRRSVLTLNRSGAVRREVMDIPGVC